MNRIDEWVSDEDLSRDEIFKKYKLEEASLLLSNHAVELKKKGKFEASEIAFRRAIAISPNSGHLYNGLGSTIWNLGRYEEAQAMYNKALELSPHDIIPYSNIALLLSSQQKYPEARKYLEDNISRAITFGDKKLEVASRWDMAMMLLDSGQWPEGWNYYDIRIEHRGNNEYPKMPFPQWQGEDLNGKTLYVQAEQGIGDRILFSRYLHWIKTTYPDCRILYLGTTKNFQDLTNLLWNYNGIVEFLPDEVPWPKADFGTYLLSLPRLHGSTIDNVYPDPGLIKERLKHDKHLIELPKPHTKNSLRIGVCWTGNPEMHRNHERSIPFELIMKLEENPNVQLYSLQFGSGEHDIERFGAEQLICNIVPQIATKGLIGTSIAMMNLDLVITVCTSVAHLAGALGVPTWTMLCYDPYWIWLRGRNDTVWYPNMKLFRQPKPNDWESVINEVQHELKHFEKPKYKLKDGVFK